jgi:membrane fusion protein, heavy metal efflux system
MKGLATVFLTLFSVNALAAGPITLNENQQSMLGVQAQPIEMVDQAWGLSYPAKIAVPNAQLRVISTPFAGITESLQVAEGDAVTKGQLIAIIQSTELLQKLGEYIDAQSKYNLARTELKRDTQLSKDGIIAERRLLETQARYTQAKTSAEQARQTLEYAGYDKDALAEISRTRKISSRLEIRASQDGVVLEQMIAPGEQLQALAPIFRIGKLSPLWLEIHVPLEQVATIQPGMDVRVRDPEISGKVLTIGRMVHGADQGVLVRAEVPDETGQLRPGQFVQIDIAQGEGSQRFSIPRSALVRDGGKAMVFIRKGESYEARPVEIVSEGADRIIIQGDFAADDQIVVTGTAALKSIWLEGAE